VEEATAPTPVANEHSSIRRRRVVRLFPPPLPTSPPRLGTREFVDYQRGKRFFVGFPFLKRNRVFNVYVHSLDFFLLAAVLGRMSDKCVCSPQICMAKESNRECHLLPTRAANGLFHIERKLTCPKKIVFWENIQASHLFTSGPRYLFSASFP